MTRPQTALPTYYTAAEVAEVLRIKPIEAGRLCRTGAIKASKPGKAWLITPEALNAYIEGRDGDGTAA